MTPEAAISTRFWLSRPPDHLWRPGKPEDEAYTFGGGFRVTMAMASMATKPPPFLTHGFQFSCRARVQAGHSVSPSFNGRPQLQFFIFVISQHLRWKFET
jgi:hypothetical protein